MLAYYCVFMSNYYEMIVSSNRSITLAKYIVCMKIKGYTHDCILASRQKTRCLRLLALSQLSTWCWSDDKTSPKFTKQLSSQTRLGKQYYKLFEAMYHLKSSGISCPAIWNSAWLHTWNRRHFSPFIDNGTLPVLVCSLIPQVDIPFHPNTPSQLRTRPFCCQSLWRNSSSPAETTPTFSVTTPTEQDFGGRGAVHERESVVRWDCCKCHTWYCTK